jgi:uncharacterized protein DUF4214
MRLRIAILTGVTGLMLSAGGDAFAQSYGYRDRPVSREYRYGRDGRATQVVRQAYRDILRREPDRRGLREYTDAMVNRGWSESDVRRALRRSPEYAQKFGGSRWRGRR